MYVSLAKTHCTLKNDSSSKIHKTFLKFSTYSRGNSEKANQNSSLILEKEVSTLQHYSVGWNLGPIALVPF